MSPNNVEQAILLLCSFFNKNESRNIKPLTPTEYSRLAAWLHQNKYTPADFLSRQEELLSQWQDPKDKITKERLAELLQRAASMGFALEKWQQQNVWVLSRGSQDYPKVLKDKMGDTRVPLLYGIGNQALLNTPSIGFVGSRDTNADDEAFTKTLAQQAVEQNFTVISGGAKGVDQTSMIAALDMGGSSIGILADSLLKAATKPQYRKALQEGRLLLVTPYYPEAGFNEGALMGRNKYIYLLSKGVVVAKSAIKGGTWEGAIENIKKQWVPLWVRDIEQAGNQQLIEKGGQSLPDGKVDFNNLQSNFSFDPVVNRKVKGSIPLNQPDLFSQPMGVVEEQSSTEEKICLEQSLPLEDSSPKLQELSSTEKTIKPVTKKSVIDRQIEQEPTDQAPIQQELTHQPSSGTFLELFYQQLQQQKEQTHTPKNLAEIYPELSEAIIKQWLNTLEEQSLVKRQGRKLAYTLIAQ